MAKRTILTLVQEIGEGIDTDEIDSLNETEEVVRIVNILEQTLKEVLDRTEGKVAGDLEGHIDNRTINIIVQSEHSKELTQSINKRITEPD